MITRKRDLKEGSFYWVIPSFDHDLVIETEDDQASDAAHDARGEHWSNGRQPARFAGWTDENDERWIFLGVDDESTWSVIWVGEEVIDG